MKVYTGSGKDVVIKPPYVKNQELGGGDTPYIMPRQTGAGNTRGVQNIQGSITITDPTTGVTRMIMGFRSGAFK